jgi:hypothetical protein
MDYLKKNKELLEEKLFIKQNELNIIRKKLEIVKKQIYNSCNHEFKMHVENCMYPETFYICKNCGYEQ